MGKVMEILTVAAFAALFFCLLFEFIEAGLYLLAGILLYLAACLLFNRSDSHGTE